MEYTTLHLPLLPASCAAFSAIIAALSLGLAAAHAQSGSGSIFGRISDTNSKLTLSGARVSVVGTSLEAFSDQQGNYALASVPAGPATVNISYVGYPTQTLQVTVVSGQAVRLDSAFAAEVVKLNAFVITGSVVGTARAINEQRSAPALTDIVASDAIGQLPDKNVAEALERVPGVDIAKDKGEGRFVIIRGLDPQYIGISMNGVRMSTSEKGSRGSGPGHDLLEHDRLDGGEQGEHAGHGHRRHGR